MYLGEILLLSAISSVSCGWLEQLTYRGMDLGYGATLHLDHFQKENASLLESHSLRLDYNGIGFSINKIPRRDAVQFGVFYRGNEEGKP